MSRRLPHLERRGATYYARFYFPLDLAEQIGLAEVRRSLDTKEYSIARHRCRKAEAWFSATVEWLKRMASPTRAEFEQLANTFFAQLAKEIDKPRHFDEPFEIALPYQVEETNAAIGRLSIALRTNEFTAKDDASARHMLDGTGLKLDELDDHSRLMAVSFAVRAELQQMKYFLNALTNPTKDFVSDDDLFGRPRNTVEVPLATSVAPPVIRPDIDLNRAIDLYLSYQKKKGWKGSMRDEALRVLGWLSEEIPASTPLAAITVDQIREFRDGLMNLVQGAQGKKLPFRARVFPEGTAKLTFKTRERYWLSIRKFFAWFRSEYQIPDPTNGLLFEGGKDELPRTPEPFSTEELRHFLAAPLFTGYQSPKRLLSPGSMTVRNGYWWSAMLMIFTGMRASDVVQLLPSDFVFDGEVPHVVIQPGMLPEGFTKSSKFGQRTHRIPLHSALFEMGIREFVAAREKLVTPKRLLFEVSLGGNRRSAGMTKFWTRYLEKFNLFKPGRSTHCHRHTFAARLRAAHVSNEDIGALLGHVGTSTTAGYGGAQDLKRKLATLAKLDFSFDIVAAVGGPFDPKKHL